MRIDIATIAGMLVGVSVVGLAIWSGSEIDIFINVPSILIVFGGTFAAILVKFPLEGVFVALPLGLKAAFMNDKTEPRDYIRAAMKLNKLARKDGVHTLEKSKISNPFFRKGVQMVADGRELDYIRKILTQEMARAIEREELGARVFDSIGDAAPAFGMFGTLVGLVQMLAAMDDPSKIGPSMAVALITTLYGVLIANLLAIPIADKLANKSRQDKELRALVIECVFQIQLRTNPMEMMEILETFLPEKQRRAGQGDSYTAGRDAGKPGSGE